MPQHLEIFKKINFFCPGVILNPVRSKFSELPLQLADPEKTSDIQAQYRNLLNVQWLDIFDEILSSAHEFWKKVNTLTNAVGEPRFREIAELAFTLLSLPSSNAIVKRYFSLMNIVKNKIRNRKQRELLNSIVTIKSYFSVNKICCKIFQPSVEMLRCNSSIYNNVNNEDDDRDSEEMFEICTNII